MWTRDYVRAPPRQSGLPLPYNCDLPVYLFFYFLRFKFNIKKSRNKNNAEQKKSFPCFFDHKTRKVVFRWSFTFFEGCFSFFWPLLLSPQSFSMYWLFLFSLDLVTFFQKKLMRRVQLG